MTMPGDIFLGIGSYFGDALVDAVNDGSVNESRVDVSDSLVSLICCSRRGFRIWLPVFLQDGA